MAIVQVNKRGSGGKWAGIMLAAVPLAVALAWWARSESAIPLAPLQERAALPQPEAVPPSAPATVQAPPDPALVAMQQAAAQALASQSAPAPVKGLVRERPDYVSVMEWTLLQAVARHHLHPEAELTRLVNSLRFNKQLERWQDTALSLLPAERQALARSLVDDLPARVQHGDMDLPGARQVLDDTLAALEPDAEARPRRLEAELQRLKAAEAQHAVAEVKRP
jgi:hypothetical protein